MNQTSYSPDKFGTYLSHPGSQGCDIDLSSANVLEILLAYRAFRQTLNASYSNENIVRRTFISYNVMRCPTEAEVRKCSGHKSMKTFERYITFDED